MALWHKMVLLLELDWMNDAVKLAVASSIEGKTFNWQQWDDTS